MLSEISDFGLIFIAIAIFGYIISDAYNKGRYFWIPDVQRKGIQIKFGDI